MTPSTGPGRSPSTAALPTGPVPGAPAEIAGSAATPPRQPGGRVGAQPVERLGAAPQREGSATIAGPGPAMQQSHNSLGVPTAAGQPAAVADAPTSQWPRSGALGIPDQELAAYLLVRGLQDRPVSPPTMALLQRANETKKEVLSTMRYGRANVSTDLEATRNQGFHRLLAQRHVSGSTSSLGEAAHISSARDAALSAYVGSGNCGEFANVAAHTHAGRLLDGEKLVMQKASDCDHSWVMLQGATRPDGTPRQVIIDVWGEGPVIEPADGEFIANAASPALTVHSIDSKAAPALSRQFTETAHDPGERAINRLGSLAEANARNKKQPASGVYEPVPIVSHQFQQAAHAAIEGHQNELPLRAQAAALARQLAPSLSKRDENSAVDAILNIAGDLHSPRSRQLESSTLKRKQSFDGSD